MTTRLRARPVLRSRALLGESPRWDDRLQRLVWVDILRGELHAFDPASGVDDILANAGRHLGAVAPCGRARSGFAAAVREGVAGLLDGGAVPDVPFLEHRPDLRTNDARADPAGRLWVGAISYAGTPGEGGLWRVDPDGTATEVVPGMGQPNGLDWSPDGTLMYLVDTFEHAIDVFRFDAGEGTLAQRRRWRTIEGPGVPDGLAVDADGGVWVALYGGGAVHRYAPGGDLDVVVEIPGAGHVTSPAFGGPRLDRLFVSTATEGLDDDALAAQEHAGDLFAVDHTGHTGRPTTAFAA